LKIGFIEPGLHVCGGIRRIIETSNRLVQFGHSVTILTPQALRCTWLPHKANIAGLGALSSRKFDIIIFNLAEQFREALAANATKKVFWVLAPEALYKPPQIPIAALAPNFYFIANSKFTVQYIKTYAHKRIKQDIPIVPGGINPDHFRYDPKQKRAYHAMYYGSKRQWKGTGIIETALRSLQFTSFKMEGLNTPQDQLYKLYNAASSYISAGQVEGFNFPILEAMACGCPVICTDDGGSRDFVRDEVNALVVRRNYNDIRNAMVKLIAHKDLQEKLRKAGLETAAEKRFDWDNATRRFESILKDLLKNA
jgi:glycosyltransferase involved in cell wall biosynthesis